MIDILIFIFTYVPALFVHLILISGFMGILLSTFNIPIVLPISSKIIQYLSIILIVIGIYLEGGLAINNEYLQRSDEWNRKVQVAEENAKIANENIRVVYIDRIKTIEKIKYITKNKIYKYTDKMNKECTLIPEILEIHNDAAKGLDK